MYLPKSKYKTSIATKQDSLVDPNGVLYEGAYFETFKGEKFTGSAPSNSSKRLTDITGPDQTDGTLTLGFVEPVRVTDYDIVREDKKELQLRATLPVPIYYPKPSQKDYTKGNFKRYFAVDKTTGQILEVSPAVYASMKAQKPEYYYPKYRLKTLKWSLQKRSENRINAAVTKLDSYLKDPSQFVR